MDLARLEASGALLDEEAANPLLGAGPDDRQVGDVPVGDPALGAADDPVAAVATGASRHAGRVGAELGLRQPEAADHLALRHRRGPAAPPPLPPRPSDQAHRPT